MFYSLILLFLTSNLNVYPPINATRKLPQRNYRNPSRSHHPLLRKKKRDCANTKPAIHCPTRMMDIFQQRYYKINLCFLSAIGQWPYQSRRRRFFALAIFTFITVMGLIPQIIAVVKYSDDSTVVFDSMPVFGIQFACGTKLANIFINSDKMLRIMQHIKFDWESMARQPEIYLLQEYAERGRQFTIAYTVGFYAVSMLFMVQPVLPQILQAIGYSNETQRAELPVPVDYYGADLDTYYYYVLVYSCICSTAIITVIIAADTMFIVQVQHACAMFTALGHQLKRMADSMTDNYEIDPRPKDDPAFRHLIICIKNHNAVIEFGELLEEAYSWAFLSLVGCNMLVMSVTGFQTVMVMGDNPQDAIRYAVLTIAQMLHLFFQSFFSQKLLDHSVKIHGYICQSEWYKTSLCAQKLLNLMTMRTYAPCQLTAGKFLVMSLGTFTSIMKTSVSYFTLLRSMH